MFIKYKYSQLLMYKELNILSKYISFIYFLKTDINYINLF